MAIDEQPAITRRRAIEAFAAAIGGLAFAPGAFAQNRSQPALDPALLRAVHPELRQAIIRFIERLRNPAMAAGEVVPRAGAGDTTSDVHWTEGVAPVAGSNPGVRLFAINAKPDTSRPAILHTHGGGFIGGGARDSLSSLCKLASQLDCVIVTVDYRLAPQTTWRGSVEDNYAGLKWLYANSGPLGVDKSRIAVMGESAGGGHAALLALAARDRGEVPVMFQCLIYPMLDDRTGVSRTPPFPIGHLGWDAAKNREGWQAFLGMAPGTASVPAAAVPARAANLSGLPSTWIGVGAIDLFVDEDIAYARRLIAAGVATELSVVPGAFHGFDALPDALGLPASISTQFNDAKLNALRRAFGQQLNI